MSILDDLIRFQHLCTDARSWEEDKGEAWVLNWEENDKREIHARSFLDMPDTAYPNKERTPTGRWAAVKQVQNNEK